ncbi:hypothetical protein F5Y04DRAFT_255081 [Hypomontagnella monticulosa]|nr:hypothetical protein F5Y04DRAFT_255081 [Hypomontagnella monticulosa]
MGSYISKDTCLAQYNISMDCTVAGHNTTDSNGKIIVQAPFTRIGNYTKGSFPGDPDIAGIGILGVFVAVTSFALALGVMSACWQMAKIWKWKKRHETPRKERQDRTSFSDILEALILVASDQQVFTGAAYALTLRYWRGCTISAYHYNIVANMMLLTCATHLVSVTIVRNYWKFPWLALLRIGCITFVFIATGLLMTNQNADTDMDFPTGIPNANETDSAIFLPAACFQVGGPTALSTFRETTSSADTFFKDNIAASTPRNKIQGFNLYIISLLYYALAIIAESIRFIKRGEDTPGPRKWICDKFGMCFRAGTIQRGVMNTIYLFYIFLGVGISCAVTIISAQYIFNLRAWVNKSGWIQPENGQNPENDAKSFGQLVPIFSSALIVFGFAQIISEKCTQHRNRKGKDNEAPVQYYDGYAYNMVPPAVPEKDQGGYFGMASVSTNSLPPRVGLQHQMSWGSETNVGSSQGATPLLSGNGYFTPQPSGYSFSPPMASMASMPSMPSYPVRPQLHTHNISSSSQRSFSAPLQQHPRASTGSRHPSQEYTPQWVGGR